MVSRKYAAESLFSETRLGRTKYFRVVEGKKVEIPKRVYHDLKLSVYMLAQPETMERLTTLEAKIVGIEEKLKRLGVGKG